MTNRDSSWWEGLWVVVVWLAVGMLAGLYLGEKIFKEIKPTEPVEANDAPVRSDRV